MIRPNEAVASRRQDISALVEHMQEAALRAYANGDFRTADIIQKSATLLAVTINVATHPAAGSAALH